MYKVIFLFFLIFPFSVFASESNGTITSGFGLTRICQDQTCSTSGRVNWRPTINVNTPGLTPVSITDSGLGGYVWGDEIGWVNLSPTGTGVIIDPVTGVLSGNAFSNTGSWINFNPTQAPGNPAVGVSIDSNGEFKGWAYVSGIKGGWMEFSCSNVNTCIKTDWRPLPDRVGVTPTSTPSTTSPIFGSSSGTLIKQTDPVDTTSSSSVTNTVVVSNVDISFSNGLITVVWETNIPTDSKVNYTEVGTLESATKVAVGRSETTTHEVTFPAPYGVLMRIDIITGIDGDEPNKVYEYTYITEANSSRRVVPTISPEQSALDEEVDREEEAVVLPGSSQAASSSSSRSGLSKGQGIEVSSSKPAIFNLPLKAIPATLWAILITAAGLLSLLLRPLVESSRISYLTDAVLATRRLLGILMPRRKRITEPWGTVYDAKTKRALDPAYVALLSVETEKEVTSAITDMEGRYGFLVKPGSYRVVPTKSHYSFPSNHLAGQNKDLIYDNLYFGQVFTVTDTGEVIRSNIPMDQTGSDWNEEEKVRMGVGNRLKKRQLCVYALNTFFVLGLSYSLYAWSIVPNLVNSVILFFYAFIWLGQVLWRRRFPITRVTYRGVPLSYALIKVFSLGVENPVKTLVTDMDGQFYTLVPPGTYRITIEERKAENQYVQIHTIDRLRLNQGVFQKDISIR